MAKIPNRNSPPTYLIRECYRENGEVKNRTLANITQLPIEQIQLISCVLKGERLIPADDHFRILRSQPHGHVQAVFGMIRHLQLPQLIAHRRCRERDLVLAMIVQRLLKPSSKLAKRHLGNGDHVLYDVSSSSYTGKMCLLARFGHNRDGRRDLPCIVYGVMTDDEGRPLASAS